MGASCRGRANTVSSDCASQPAKRGSGSPFIPRSWIENRLPRKTPSPGKRGNGGFAIAGADKKFVWAKAVIVDPANGAKADTVAVSSKEVPDPVAVRYAWADNPVCNLYNDALLPVTPFRTDDWKGVTANVNQ